MARPSSWRIGRVVLLVSGVGTGCSIDNTIHDDFGIAGYARLQGTVSHADGSRFGSITIEYSCGEPEPTWFGSSATTSADGAFDIDVDAPAAGTLPASGTLVCEVRVPSHIATARARATVSFSQTAAARPITTFTLVEGQSIP